MVSNVRQMTTHLIGSDTVNRTANLPRGLDRQFGRWVVENDAKSRSDVMKRLVHGLVSGAIQASQLGLVLLIGVGTGVVL